jgi:hypothetical protein
MLKVWRTESALLRRGKLIRVCINQFALTLAGVRRVSVRVRAHMLTIRRHASGASPHMASGPTGGDVRPAQKRRPRHRRSIEVLVARRTLRPHSEFATSPTRHTEPAAYNHVPVERSHIPANRTGVPPDRNPDPQGQAHSPASRCGDSAILPPKAHAAPSCPLSRPERAWRIAGQVYDRPDEKGAPSGQEGRSPCFLRITAR